MSVVVHGEFGVNGMKLIRWTWGKSDIAYRWDCTHGILNEYALGEWLVSENHFVLNTGLPQWLKENQVTELVKFIEAYERLQ